MSLPVILPSPPFIFSRPSSNGTFSVKPSQSDLETSSWRAFFSAPRACAMCLTPSICQSLLYVLLLLVHVSVFPTRLQAHRVVSFGHKVFWKLNSATYYLCDFEQPNYETPRRLSFLRYKERNGKKYPLHRVDIRCKVPGHSFPSINVNFLLLSGDRSYFLFAYPMPFQLLKLKYFLIE